MFNFGKFIYSSYQKDAWLWSLDWTVQGLSLKKEKIKKTSKRSKKKDLNEVKNCDDVMEIKSKLQKLSADELIDEEICDWYPDLPKADDVLYKRRQHMNGFPRYFVFCSFCCFLVHKLLRDCILLCGSQYIIIFYYAVRRVQTTRSSIYSKLHYLIHKLYLTNHHSFLELLNCGTHCHPLLSLNPTICHLLNLTSANLILSPFLFKLPLIFSVFPLSVLCYRPYGLSPTLLTKKKMQL